MSKLDWIGDLKRSDMERIMNQYGRDMSLVYANCRLETLLDLWENMSGVPIYVSERALNELRKHYVRKNFDPKDPENSTKAIAVRLRASTQFVREALEEATPKDDPRQLTLLGKGECNDGTAMR